MRTPTPEFRCWCYPFFRKYIYIYIRMNKYTFGRGTTCVQYPIQGEIRSSSSKILILMKFPSLFHFSNAKMWARCNGWRRLVISLYFLVYRIVYARSCINSRYRSFYQACRAIVYTYVSQDVNFRIGDVVEATHRPRISIELSFPLNLCSTSPNPLSKPRFECSIEVILRF